MEVYDTFREQLKLADEEIEALLALDPAALLATPAACRIIVGVDIPVLQASLPEAQECMKAALPHCDAWLRHDLGVDSLPTSTEQAIEWVGDVLVGRRAMLDLIQPHNGLSAEVIMLATPRLVGIFDDLPFGRAAWQRATALLCLVLLAAAQHTRANTAAELQCR